MKKNVGNVDKVVRILIAALIAVLYFTDVISGTLAIVLGIVAIMMIITSFISFCGLYTLFGVNTCSRKKS